MKKIFSFVILIVAFCSCESDVKFSDPGFQGRKDNFAWRADISSAHFEFTDPAFPNEGYLTVTAFRGLESVTLTFPFDRAGVITKFNPVTFQLGPTADVSDDITAAYSYEDNGFVLEYSTAVDDGHGDSVGNATISINGYDNVKQTISGTFKFNAKYTGESTVVQDNVNYQEGVFYHVPIQ